MIELKSARDRSDEETVVLFKLDDVEHKVPARPRVNFALQYLVDVEERGAFLAELKLLQNLAGTEAYAALCAADLDPEDLTKVQEYAVHLCLGSLEEAPQGNAERGSKKSAG